MKIKNEAFATQAYPSMNLLCSNLDNNAPHSKSIYKNRLKSVALKSYIVRV